APGLASLAPGGLGAADGALVVVLLPGARLLQHFVGLADAGRGADEDLEASGLTLFAPRGLEQGLRRRSLVRVAPLIRHRDSNSLHVRPAHLTPKRIQARWNARAANSVLPSPLWGGSARCAGVGGRPVIR